MLSGGRKTGFTFAPEAATDRMRDMINKYISTEALLETVDEVYRLPKLDAAVIAQGDSVDLDISAGTNGEIDDNSMTPASGDLSDCGIAWEGKGATTGETILVKLNAAGLATLT